MRSTKAYFLILAIILLVIPVSFATTIAPKPDEDIKVQINKYWSGFLVIMAGWLNGLLFKKPRKNI